MVDSRDVEKRSEGLADGPTASHQKDFHCWASLRTMFGMIIPCCGCQNRASGTAKSVIVMSSTVTGTIFGHRKGRVSFCVQEDPGSSPLLLLEFAMPTQVLVKEMQSGLLRITLECEKGNTILSEQEPVPLFAEPVWSMYCNGRKVGFAVRKQQNSEIDPTTSNLMSLMQSVSTGAGMIPIPAENGKSDDDELIYMRANFERVIGSSDSQAFHMINPDGTPGQELSIFLNRS